MGAKIQDFKLNGEDGYVHEDDEETITRTTVKNNSPVSYFSPHKLAFPLCLIVIETLIIFFSIGYSTLGNAESQYSIGMNYANGEGVKQDYSKAVKWYYNAAEQGHAKAQFMLGLCYEKGDGVAKDYKQSIYWFRKAAKQGDPVAQCRLGIFFRTHSP